jgi:hypothetical protein
MNAAFVRKRLQRFKQLQEPLAVERRIQTAAGSPVGLTVAAGMWHGYVLYDLKACQADKAALSAFVREVVR